MSSKNKMFKKYLHQKCNEMKKSDPKFSLHNNSLFITKCREEWKSMSESKQLTTLNETMVSKPKTISEMNSFRKMSDPYFEENESDMFEEELEQRLIDRLIRDKTKEDLMATKICFMSSNILCIVKNTYPPIEIGLVEYSLGQGIHDTYHSFIKVEIPFGFAYSAINHMRISHKIPLDNVFSSDDFTDIGDQILDFLGKSLNENKTTEGFVDPMVVFSRSDQIEQNIGALKWLSIKYNSRANKNGLPEKDWNIKVLDVSNLLFHIFKKYEISQPLTVCKNTMASNWFDHSLDTDCNFHTNIQCIDCALGVAKRLVYILSQSLNDVLKLQLTANHLPKLGYNSLIDLPVNQFVNSNDFQKLRIKDQNKSPEEEKSESSEVKRNESIEEQENERTEMERNENSVENELLKEESIGSPNGKSNESPEGQPKPLNLETSANIKPILGIGRGRKLFY